MNKRICISVLAGDWRGKFDGKLGIDFSETNAMIERVFSFDKELGFELEAAISASVCEAARKSFEFGWRVAEKPEILIVENEESEQPLS